MSNSTLIVNGKEYSLTVSPHHTLLHVLREELGLVGAREGCGIGICGTCTVLVDGKAISSCLMLAVQAVGREIMTIEGLADDKHLHPVQQAFLEHLGFQCGYCTPGFILSSVALLTNHANPSEDTVREYLSGNLCRCGSYPNILKAVMSLRESSEPESLEDQS
jgi:aerobic-type carbon monoxide dehydrogenase small subunit (CoxS/CutS family)